MRPEECIREEKDVKIDKEMVYSFSRECVSYVAMETTLNRAEGSHGEPVCEV